MSETTPQASVQAEVLGLSDWVWDRTRTRLQGLDDTELFWEPYPGCWTLRKLQDGTWAADFSPQPLDISPLTTIVWRIIHLIGCYGSGRNSQWLGVHSELPAVESWDVHPTTASEALSLLEQAHDHWRSVLVVLDDAGLAERLGPIGGRWAESTRGGFLAHQLDEVIHHSAEIGLMRDLYRASTGRIHADPVVARLMCGDLGAFDDAAVQAADVVGALAEVGRWDLVDEALSRGLPPEGATSPTALHRAAVIGMTPMVERLLAAGADRTRRDPQFNATPSDWAAFSGHTELAARLAPESIQ